MGRGCWVGGLGLWLGLKSHREPPLAFHEPQSAACQLRVKVIPVCSVFYKLVALRHLALGAHQALKGQHLLNLLIAFESTPVMETNRPVRGMTFKGKLVFGANY